MLMILSPYTQKCIYVYNNYKTTKYIIIWSKSNMVNIVIMTIIGLNHEFKIIFRKKLYESLFESSYDTFSYLSDIDDIKTKKQTQNK